MSDTDDIRWLRQQGYRLTPQRLQVLAVVRAQRQHLTAEDIHDAILPQQPSLDIATVYRTLQWLERVGLVAPISVGDGRTRYEYHPHGKVHHHLVCRVCGATTQVPDELLTGVAAAVRRRHGFVLDEHLALPGRCAACDRAGAGNAAPPR
jgi:Fur family ferric uptake transcriptional regulator